ncbi:MAG: zinc-binding dehydrogenase [Parvibaculaceae bacterium]
MKAVHVKAAGGTDQLVYGDWPDPVIGPDEVLVQVKAAGLNHADIWLRKGMLGPLPMVPGIDCSGVIADVGTDVPDIVKAGMRVVLNPSVTCGVCTHCLTGEHGSCRQRRAIGQFLDGSYAEYVKIPWMNVHQIPDSMPFEEAAAIPGALFTAWQLIVMRAKVIPSETVVVMAAGSGVGSASVQVAKVAGARVIATAGSDRKLDKARELGADETINYSTEDFAARVLELTNGEGAHVIIDTLGAEQWPDYLKCVRVGGRVVTCSFTTGRKPDLDIMTLMSKQISLIGSGGQGSKPGIANVMKLIHQGHLRGVVDRTFPLKEAAAAQEAMEDRAVIGKIILIP